MLRRTRLCVLVVALCLPLMLLAASDHVVDGASLLRMHVIDVGQGDAVLLQGGDGFEVLVDGGERYAGPTVVAFLREQGVTDLEVMVATHPHADHIGGLISVLQSEIPVGAVVYNGCAGDTLTWSDFVAAMAARGLTPTPARFPSTHSWGSLQAQVLHPGPTLSALSTNDTSVVLLVVHGDVHTLLTGDISQTVEPTIIARGTPASADILKVAHHGSASSSGQPFLEHVGPSDAIICVGDNSYGHPTDASLTRLAAAGARIWRTDWHGTITVTSDGSTYTILAAKVPRICLPFVVREFPTAP